MRLRTLGGLWIEGAEAGTAGGPRPRRLALLAILAAAAPNAVTRERVLGVLWPDSEPERGRHTLSQTLYTLRRDLGVEAVVSSATDLRIDLDRLTVDLEEFRAAVVAGEFGKGAELYAGPFLDGFRLADAPEFERWVEDERSSLLRDGMRVIEASAREAARDGRAEDAVRAWHRLTKLDALNSHFAAAYMEALAAVGDRPGALTHGRAHTDLLRRELGSDPAPSLVRLMSRLGEPARHPSPISATKEARSASPIGPESEAVPTIDPKAIAVEAGALPSDGVAAVGVKQRSSTTSKWMRRVASLVGVVLLAVVAWRAMSTRSRASEPVLAVGLIRDLVAPDSVLLGGVLSEMLATSLGRLTDLSVIANSRILELTPRDADTVRTAHSDAARRAGATEILEGELVPLPDQQMRLSIRRIDLARGLVRGGYQVTSSDRLALLDSVTILIAADLRVAAPTGSLAEVSTRSPIAYRLYEDGLRAFYQFDSRAANRLFRASMQEDSTFAMATYYAWRSAVAIDGASHDSLADRAIALSTRASERDRLMILTHVASTRADRRAEAVADSLAIRFPHDPDALVRAAGVIHDVARASALLNRAIALDSAAAGPTSACLLCDAFSQLVAVFAWTDSLDAVEHTLDRWSALRPADHAPWMARADFLITLGRRSAADSAYRRGIALGAQPGDERERQISWSLRLDDLSAADSLCRSALSSVDQEAFPTFRWLCTIGLRMQGRYREAQALVREGRPPGAAIRFRDLPPDHVNGALLDMAMGRTGVAADEFESLGAEYRMTPNYSPGLRARGEAWNLTLAATAAIEGGDTLRARGLVDSIEVIGSRSLYRRDPLLHHFIRGLFASRAGQHEVAVRELRAAVFSPSNGYTRVSYELARSLLALGRPAEAIPVLRHPLHGGIEGAGLYLTRTELHELLGQAFDANGESDSALVHHAVVERAWRHADPSLAGRYAAVRRRLGQGRRGVR